MIQDFLKGRYDNRYYPEKKVSENSHIIYFTEGHVLCHATGDLTLLKDAIPGKKLAEELSWNLPTLGELNEISEIHEDDLTYLFQYNKKDYFLVTKDIRSYHRLYSYGEHDFTDLSYVEAIKFRSLVPLSISFVVITARQLYCWYRDNTFCGRCGSRLMHGQTERMLKCPDCSNVIYPKISPGVIVGIMSKGRILLTKYAKKGYNRYALVAGFTEIGETLEETAKREALEEVGLKLKNVTFYKSQPWSASGSLLAGFFAEVDGEDTVVLDEDELREATWFYPHEIVKMTEGVSLTEEMINYFADGHIKSTGE